MGAHLPLYPAAMHVDLFAAKELPKRPDASFGDSYPIPCIRALHTEESLSRNSGLHHAVIKELPLEGMDNRRFYALMIGDCRFQGDFVRPGNMDGPYQPDLSRVLAEIIDEIHQSMDRDGVHHYSIFIEQKDEPKVAGALSSLEYAITRYALPAKKLESCILKADAVLFVSPYIQPSGQIMTK